MGMIHFFFKMISKINFYNFFRINENESILQEIKRKISNKKCKPDNFREHSDSLENILII